MIRWRLIGQRVQARSTATSVQIIHDSAVVATHVRAERGRRTNPDHYPPEKIAFHLRTPTWCRTTAAGVGPACESVIGALLVDNALFRIRAAQGILGLRTKHGNTALEDACTTALAAGDPSYRTIKGILALKPPAGAGPSNDRSIDRGRAEGVPAFLRGQQELFSTEPTTATTTATTTAATTATTTATTNVVHLPTTSINDTISETTSEVAR